MIEAAKTPFVFDFIEGDMIIPSRVDNHIKRSLSAMKGQFLDQEAYRKMLEREDTLLYEVFEIRRPEVAGELLHGVSIVHPGKVGSEYFMTKGHFHKVQDTAEIYYTLKGSGYMVMETPQGDWAVEPLRPNSILYVPPYWAHRSVNTSPDQDLIMFFVYPGNAGHDYGSIERQGCRKIVIEQDGVPAIVDNPRWLPPEARE
jgi:glucose-6-phosphate isomerase